MTRREALRLLATGTALGLATPKMSALLRDARAVVQTKIGHATLTSHQNETVTAIAEMIIPRTDTPGATDAGVPAFVDLIVTEWYTDEQRADFLNGLTDVDVQAQHSFTKEFIECSSDQRAEILTQLGAKMIADAERTKTQNAAGDLQPPDNFYQTLRSLILTGYYTSEAGATAELNYQVIPTHFDACADAAAGKEAQQIGEK